MFQTFDSIADPSVGGPRLALLRAELARLNLDGFIVPRADEHQGEYVPECAARLKWVSGFSGSAGTAVVLKDKAALFVDGRYHTQADREVDLARWSVVKNALGVSNEKATGDKLIELAKDVAEDLVVGFEPDRYAVSTMEAFEKRGLRHNGHGRTLLTQ